MALKIVKGSIDRMFDKNLQDLVRGIRNHKEDEVKARTAVTWSVLNLTFIDVFDVNAYYFFPPVTEAVLTANARWINDR